MGRKSIVSQVWPGFKTPASRRQTGRRRHALPIEMLEPRQMLSVTQLTTGGTNDSIPDDIVDVSGTAYFNAADGTHGNELWKSNGTATGTVLVKDINPGANYGSANSSAPAQLTNVNGTLFFVADDGTHGEELWKSNGTATGTVMVKDVFPGASRHYGSNQPNSSSPSNLTNVNGVLYFDAKDGTHGDELWKSDGSASGTVFVKDINPRISHYVPVGSGAANFTGVGGTLYFTANDGTHGVELWKSNGTATGTVLVSDINKTTSYNISSNPASLTNVNGTLFFSANDGSIGTELWKSNGTSTGTVVVKDIRTTTYGSGSYFASNPTLLTNVNGTLYFDANDGTHGFELWKSNGTSSGTVLLSSLNSTYSTTTVTIGDLTNFGGTLLFDVGKKTSGFGSPNSVSHELWKSSGTASGTVAVANLGLSTYTGYSNGAGPGGFTTANGVLYFYSGTGTTLTQLFKSNGTSSGTVLVKNIGLGNTDRYSSGSHPLLTNVNGTLFFRANDGTHGYELWKTSGTSSGTVLTKDINSSLTGLGNSVLTANVNGTLFFSANGALWKSDGSSAGTVLVARVNATNLTTLNSTLFFSADDGTHGSELWKSNGTSSGTLLVRDIRPGSNPSNPANLVNMNSTLFFTANDGTKGVELWKSNGTSTGTVLVRDINSKPPVYYGAVSSSSPANLTNLGGTLYFSANDGTNGVELWKSNGTSTGTVLVKDIFPGVDAFSSNSPYGSYPTRFTNVNGTLFFDAKDGTHGNELWKSNGTSTGTVLVKDIYPGAGPYVPYSSAPGDLTNVSGTLYFSANDGTHGLELWKSNGTSTGTVLVKDINTFGSSTGEYSFIGSSNPAALTNLNGRLYFVANDGLGGSELWQSNGTASGTITVAAIRVGEAHYGTPTPPADLSNVNGKLYFSANDNSHGYELWGSDGTVAGTVMIQDLIPGSMSSNPQHLTGAGNFLFFTASTQFDGIQLFSQFSPITLNGIKPFSPTSAFTTATSVTFQATFSEPMKGVDTNVATDFALSGTAISGGHIGTPTTSDGGLNWLIPVTGLSATANGTVQLNLTHNTGIVDTATSKPLGISTLSGQPYTLDHVAPTVVGIFRSSPASATTNLPSVTFLVKFSEAVMGVDTNFAADFALSGTAISGAHILAPTTTNGGISWLFCVAGYGSTVNGTVQMNLTHNTGIKDLASNALSTSTLSGQAYTLDRVIPTGAFAPVTTPTTTAVPSVTIQFSEAVQNVTTSNFTLNGTLLSTLSGVTIAAGTTANSYVISGLAAFDATAKSYTLAVAQSNSIADLAGNFLATPPSVTWIKSGPVAMPVAKAAPATKPLDDYWSTVLSGSQASPTDWS